MKILGISSDIWITSAVLVEDGRIIAAAPEERFNRQKMYRNFPLEAIKYCLKEANCSLEDVDYINLYEYPDFTTRVGNMSVENVISRNIESTGTTNADKFRFVIDVECEIAKST